MKVLFIGNRYNVLECLLEISGLEVEILALRDSVLENILVKNKISFIPFELQNKEDVLQKILYGDYDVLISNGCPFIIPVNENMDSKLLINIHPTYLPELRGKTPLNGIFFNGLNYLGATMHYISEEIDAGNIIYQEKIPVTEDIDQGLVYFLSFKMEATVFKKGWDILSSNNFNFIGNTIDIKAGSYFNRTKDKMIVDFLEMSTEEIIKRIKSFGVLTQGCTVKNCDISKISKIYDAEKIINPFLLKMFINNKPGELLLSYDSKYLIKTIDGIIKVIKNN